MSCRACNFSQLEVFKGLQTQTNRILAATKVELPEATRDGAGQSVLWVDGRIGTKTTTAVVLAALKAEGSAPVPPNILAALTKAGAAPSEKESMAAIAAVAPELQTYLQQVADKLQAATPAGGIPTAAERGKKSEEEVIRARETEPKKKSRWMWWALGVTALAGAGTAGYYYWYKPRKAQGLMGDGDQNDLPQIPGVQDY